MSSLKVEIVEIKTVEPHFNADRLEIATIAGWTCVVGKGTHKPGNHVIYIPIDSILSPELECHLFPPDSKIKLSKSRVRTIKIRGAISQGMIVDLSKELVTKFPKLLGKKLGDDVAGIIGVVKYEPPFKELPNLMRATSKRKSNPNFKAYTDIENFKHYDFVFEEGETVYVTEKLHGTSARYGILETEVNNPLKRILQFFRLLPKHEFCFGSRRVQLQEKPKNYKGFYEENVYAIIAVQENLRNKLQPGEAVYGEIVGSGIQKGYTYGCKQGEYKFFAYDVIQDGKYLDSNAFVAFCEARNIPRVPPLYFGPFLLGNMNILRTGDSTIADQKVREGIVIKPHKERFDNRCGRAVLKYINDDYYLDDSNTEFQ